METTASRSGGASTPDQSTTDQAKEKVQEAAEQVQQKAVEVKGQAGERVRRELDTRSTEAGTQLGQTANAMRRSGDQLRNEGKEGPAKIVTAVADRAERLGGYLTDANADRMIRDVENFARRQPVLFALGGATLGFLASRFMKASSSTRYQGGNGYGSYSSGARSSSGQGLGSGTPLAELGQGTPGGAGAYAAEPESSLSDDLASSASAGSKRGGRSGQSAD
jgi:hypothetical protein